MEVMYKVAGRNTTLTSAGLMLVFYWYVLVLDHLAHWSI